MTRDPLFILVIVSVAVTALILLTGIGGFARGGAFSRKYANRIMRWRVIAQAVSIALILLYVLMRRGG